MPFANRTVLLIGSLIAATTAQAGEESKELPELITDRPDFTESADAVPAGYIQFEMGLLDYTTLGDDNQISSPNALARIGVVQGFELRLVLPSYVLAFPGDETAHDISPVEVGGKGVLSVGDRWMVGLLPFMVLPTRPEQFDAGVMEVGAKIVSSVELTERLSLGANLGMAAVSLHSNASDPGVEYAGSLALGVGLTERWGMFLEIYTFADEDDGFAPVADGGCTYLLNPRTQLDAYIGVGFLDTSQGINTGFGISILAG